MSHYFISFAFIFNFVSIKVEMLSAKRHDVYESLKSDVSSVKPKPAKIGANS